MEERNNTIDEYGGLAEPKTSAEQILRQFKRKSVVARDWIKDLVDNGYRKAVKTGRRRSVAALEEGFFMSDEMPDVGVLSIAPSLSALLSELKELREGKDDDVAAGAMSFTDVLTANRNEVLDVVVKSVCRLLAECYPDGLHTNIEDVLFSSAPFYDGIMAGGRSVWERDGYLDTASWAFLVADLIELFLNRFEECAPELYKKTKWTVYDGDEAESLSVERVRDYVRNIYYASIRTTCDCIVKRDGKYLGWTFRKMRGSETQPSLYFSYVASTVYLGLYNRFNGTKDVIVNMRNFEEALQKKSRDENNDDIKRYRFYDGFKSAEKFNKMLEWLTRNEFYEAVKFLRRLSPNEIAELNLLYNIINDGKPLSFKLDGDDGGSFTVLKEASTGLAEMLWNEGYGTYKNKVPFSENMAKGPCFEDGSLIEMEVIKRSSHNNAFFNNLFVIGIILNSAYDMEVMKKDPKEYERMLNIFQLSIQNTQRCYDEIEERGLLYKIDSYILDFSDKVDSANTELAKQLRRVNMSVVPLMPLMLKNNNLMSQYVVQYPQKQMTESLKDIIKNRKYVGDEEKKQSWVWDKDGYNSITNYYYVDALISFYRYYKQYEEPLIENEELLRRREAQAAKNAQDQVQAKLDDMKTELNAEISKRDERIAEYRRVFKDFARLMVNGLIDVVDEQITADKLIGTLSNEEKTNRDTVIGELNSFNRDSDTVKLSSLVHLTEKLQILSLLSMDSNEQLRAFLKNSGANKYDGHVNLIADAFGTNGNSTKFMRNLLIFIIDSLAAKKPDSDN
ncbi:MAG: hypothetical protein K2M89_06120 [Clostridiales bacterium]|nr:hypothetical protein [Clostridiales bacterium]